MFYLFVSLASIMMGWHLFEFHKLIRLWQTRSQFSVTENFGEIIAELLMFGEHWRRGGQPSQRMLMHFKDTDIRDGLNTVVTGGWVQPERLMSLRLSQQYVLAELQAKVKQVRRIGAYSPLVGLAAGLAGLSYLLNNLSNTAFFDGFSLVVGLSLAFIIYGFIFTYMVIYPVAEYFLNQLSRQQIKFSLVNQMVDLLPQKPNPLFLLERLNAVVPHAERYKWEEFVSKEKVKAA